MKHLIWLPLALVAVALVAWAALRGVTGQPHDREFAFNAAIVVFATELAILPVTLARRLDPVPVFQAALAGTVVHLFLSIGLGAVVFGLQLVPDRNFFLFLLLGFYWVSLLAMIVPMVRIFRAAADRARASAGAAPATA